MLAKLAAVIGAASSCRFGRRPRFALTVVQCRPQFAAKRSPAHQAKGQIVAPTERAGGNGAILSGRLRGRWSARLIAIARTRAHEQQAKSGTADAAAKVQSVGSGHRAPRQ